MVRWWSAFVMTFLTIASCGVSSDGQQATSTPDEDGSASSNSAGTTWVDGAGFEWHYERLEPSSDECPVFAMVFTDTTEGDVTARRWEFPEEWREPVDLVEVVRLIGPVDGTVTLTVTFANGDQSRVEHEVFNEKADCPPADAATTSTAATPVSAPTPGAEIEGDTACPAPDGSSERVTSFASTPPLCIDPTATYTATIVTNLGSFDVELDPGRAPNTVNNFVVLARYRFYDGAPFHRIIPGFVIQGGDAVGSPLGTGGPGYRFDDELPEAGDYRIGSVVMANSGPDTNGSQFFVVTGANGVDLPPLYSLFGQVTSGLDVVLTIERVPTTSNDAPTEPVIIETVTVVES